MFNKFLVPRGSILGYALFTRVVWFTPIGLNHSKKNKKKTVFFFV